MKCARALDLFSSYAESAMEPPLRVAFEQHLAECRECKADYDKFNAAVMMLEELPMVEIPSGFHSSVMARVEQGRRAAPRPVRWWRLNWERVFTVRVPARAVALGMAVLLLMVMVVQLTPISTAINANFGVPRMGAKHPVGWNDPDAPKLSQTGCNLPTSGLTVCVSVGQATGSHTAYSLKFETTSSDALGFSVNMMNGASETGDEVFSGYVAKSQPSVAPIYVDRLSGRPAVARIEWTYKDRHYSELAFLPSQYAPEAATKSFSVSDARVYDVLSAISETYGIVILASGDVNKRIAYAGAENQTPSEALYNAVRSTGLKWQAVGQSIYRVQPGP